MSTPSSQTLRQRSKVNGDSTNSKESTATQSQRRRLNTGLALRSLQQASPQHMGQVEKLHIPFLYSILPIYLYQYMLKVWCFKLLLLPTWQPRYLIVLGSYLYKFKYNTIHTDQQEQQQPNGAPVRLDHLNVYLVTSKASSSYEDSIVYLASRKTGSIYPSSSSSCIFCVSTFRKKYYYSCRNHEDAIVWVNTLREASQECIKRNMGHAVSDSYPSNWIYYDCLGQDLVDRKDRIRTKLQQNSLRELEMNQYNDGGPIPRGYYG